MKTVIGPGSRRTNSACLRHRCLHQVSGQAEDFTLGTTNRSLHQFCLGLVFLQLVTHPVSFMIHCWQKRVRDVCGRPFQHIGVQNGFESPDSK